AAVAAEHAVLAGRVRVQGLRRRPAHGAGIEGESDRDRPDAEGERRTAVVARWVSRGLGRVERRADHAVVLATLARAAVRDVRHAAGAERAGLDAGDERQAVANEEDLGVERQVDLRRS